MSPTKPGTVHVFCYKKGLLSRVAHDIRLSVHPHHFSHVDHVVSARFRPKDMLVDGAIQQNQIQEHLLSAKDKRDIQKNLLNRVLEAQLFPEIALEGHTSEHGFSGTLTLKGKALPIAFEFETSNESYSGQLEITPSKWGIQPFKALFGAIQLQDRIGIHFRFPS